jgi:hypothetical protein
VNILNSEKLNKLLEQFKNVYGYELVEANKDCDYWKFKRTAEGHNHILILEDHRWEIDRPDFDIDKDIGDWLIFSMLTDYERDWFGRFVETQYPLTYTEYKMIEKIIHELEKTDE